MDNKAEKEAKRQALLKRLTAVEPTFKIEYIQKEYKVRMEGRREKKGEKKKRRE
jgi:hypothetical protein